MTQNLCDLPRVQRIVDRFFRSGDLVDREQLAFDICLKYEHPPKFIVTQRCIDAQRSAKRELRAREMLTLEPPPVYPPGTKELVNLICDCIAPNSDEQRILYLHFWQGLRGAELAQAMKLCPWSTQLLLRRTLRRLRGSATRKGIL